MPIDFEERYKLVFAEHRYASDFRAKIIQGWFLTYGALAAAFGWIQHESKENSWIVAVIGILVTIVMWVADYRNQSALEQV